MANNCLVTKLNGFVDNIDIPRFNTILFKIHAKDKAITPYQNHNFYVRGGTITCINGKTFNLVNISTGEVLESNLTTKTIVSLDWMNIGLSVAEDYVFEYTPKYEISAIGFNGNIAMFLEINLDDFNYSPNLYEFNLVSNTTNTLATGIFNPLNKSICTTIRFIRTYAKINVSDFSVSTLLRILSTTGKNIYGNIEDLYNCKQLSNIEVWGSPGVFGDVLNLFSDMATNGRTSGTLLIGASSSSVTIGGVSFDQALIDRAGVGKWAIIATFDPSAPGGYTLSYE